MNEKMTLSQEAQVLLDRKIANHKVLANAFRLMRDADALFGLRSFASCVALGSLAFEEIGKHLISQWSETDAAFSYNRRRLHQAKQDATASAIVCDSMRREYMDAGIDFGDLQNPETLTKFARAVRVGFDREKAFLNSVAGKGMEFVKWSGLYYDADQAAKGIEPDKIRSEDAQSIMQLVSRAFMAIADDKVVAVAKTFFGIMQKSHDGPPAALSAVPKSPTEEST